MRIIVDNPDVESLERGPSVPLRGAVLCLDCEHISAGRDGRCQRCESRATLPIENVVNRNQREAA